MLVLVLEFSKISAPTLYPPTNLRWWGTSRDERPNNQGIIQGACRSSKTEDESPGLRSSHLTGAVRSTSTWDREPQWYDHVAD